MAPIFSKPFRSFAVILMAMLGGQVDARVHQEKKRGTLFKGEDDMPRANTHTMVSACGRMGAVGCGGKKKWA
jgi:hypothetical protein